MEGRYEIKLPTFCMGDDHWYRFFPGEFHRERSEPLARIYFNSTSEGSIFLLEVLSQLASKHPVRFALKIAASLDYYRFRNDCGILYYKRSDEKAFSSHIKKLKAELSGKENLLRSEPLPLTHELSPGMYYAEDPKDGGTSFGMHRSQLIAEGLAQCQDRASLDDCFAVVSRVWKKAGLLSDQPWRTPL